MKKFFSLLTIIAIILVSNCTEIPENNDPILGKWYQLNTQTTTSKGVINISEEWIFNDVYLGRYHKYENNELVVLTDFSWSKASDSYTITYRAYDAPPIVVKRQVKDSTEQLQRLNGTNFALRNNDILIP